MLACEWGSVKLLLNDGGKLTDASAAWGLVKFTGLWHGVAVADFDGDANGDGVMELVEAFAETKTKQWKPIRTLEVFSETFPHIRGTITRNKTFAAASLPQIIGPAFGDMKSLEITDLSSLVFLNKTGRFEMRALPDASQLSPAFDLCSGDFDGDGAVDLFLVQNAFGVPESASRYDSGRGLLLRGDGTGNFAAVPASESGIALYGEQRGVVSCRLRWRRENRSHRGSTRRGNAAVYEPQNRLRVA